MGVGDTMDNQFVINGPNYDTPAESVPSGYTKSGPQAGLGCVACTSRDRSARTRGGRFVLVNTLFLVVASDATDGNGEGDRRGGWSRDTIAVSAGPNWLFDTPFGGSANFGTAATGDDLIYVLRDTR